jgi:hypothetical protein
MAGAICMSEMLVTLGDYVLTTTESPLLLTAELDTTDPDNGLGSTGCAEGAEEVPCSSNEDDDASKDCSACEGGGGDSLAMDSVNCETSGRGDIDKKDAELASDCASEDRTSSTLESREPGIGDGWGGRTVGSCPAAARVLRRTSAVRERD